MNELKRDDSRFNNRMIFFSMFFMLAALILPYFRTDTLGLMFSAVLLLLSGISNLLLWTGIYLGQKQNAIIEELRIANEIPPVSIDEENEKE